MYLDEDDKRRLTALAQSSGSSEAELLREGVRLVLQRAVRPRPQVAVGASGDGRTARETDALLRESGFGT